MVTRTRAQRLTVPLAPIVGMGGGVAIALLCLIMPAALLERLVDASGLPAVIAAAEPPLGFTARIALGLILGGGFAGFVGVGLSLLGGDRPVDFTRVGALLRRGDVHPDAPPRPPLFAARELGTPFLDVKAPVEAAAELDLAAFEPVARPVEQPLPRDLDQPMAGFDPVALRREPRPAPEPLGALTPAPAPPPRPALIDPGDRIEIFELTPAERAAPVSLRAPSAGFDHAPRSVAAPVPGPVVAPETEATVHDLLARLERGIARPPGPAAAATGSLAETLSDLRRLATGAH